MQSMTRIMAVASLAAAVAACESRTADDTTMTGRADTMAQMGADTITQQQEGMGERVSAELQPVNNSGASGEVNITPADGRMTVILTLDAGSAGGAADSAGQAQQHAAHIHTGTCENIGEVVAPLEAVPTVAGRGTSTTLLGQELDQFADGNHVVAAHAAGATPGAPIVCAPIPAQGAQGSDTAQTSI